MDKRDKTVKQIVESYAHVEKISYDTMVTDPHISRVHDLVVAAGFYAGEEGRLAKRILNLRKRGQLARTKGQVGPGKGHETIHRKVYGTIPHHRAEFYLAYIGCYDGKPADHWISRRSAVKVACVTCHRQRDLCAHHWTYEYFAHIDPWMELNTLVCLCKGCHSAIHRNPHTHGRLMDTWDLWEKRRRDGEILKATELTYLGNDRTDQSLL